MRFRVDRRLIDMNQDRKNQRDQTQPRYTQVGPQLFHAPLSLLGDHLKDILPGQIRICIAMPYLRTLSLGRDRYY